MMAFHEDADDARPNAAREAGSTTLIEALDRHIEDCRRDTVFIERLDDRHQRERPLYAA